MRKIVLACSLFFYGILVAFFIESVLQLGEKMTTAVLLLIFTFATIGLVWGVSPEVSDWLWYRKAPMQSWFGLTVQSISDGTVIAHRKKKGVVWTTYVLHLDKDDPGMPPLHEGQHIVALAKPPRQTQDSFVVLKNCRVFLVKDERYPYDRS